MYDSTYTADMSQLFFKTKTAGYTMALSVNQLLYSQLLSNGVWTATTMTVGGSITDSLSGTDAFTLTASGANATLKQTVILTDTLNRTFSLGIKRRTGTGDISLSVDGTTFEVVAVTGSWVRYDVTLSASGTVYPTIKIATNTDAIDVEWAQLEDGIATTYSENTSSRYATTQITDTDYPSNTTRGCAYLDGRFFVMNPLGEIYMSALDNAQSWDALDFIASQIEADEGVYLAKYMNYVVALKKYSTEFFYDAANATGSILSPVMNAAFKVGCASEDSVKEVAGTIVWMGQNRDGFGRSIYKLTGMNPEVISTPQIDKILNADSLATVYSWAANVGSHLLYGLTLVATGVTLVYDVTSKQWSFFTYLGTSGSPTTITAITTAGAVTSTAHGYSDGDIIKVASTNSDFNGWHVVTAVTTNAYEIQATGTAFSGSGTAQKHIEAYFPISASTAADGVQYLQHATSGALYTFSQSVYTDPIGAIAARVRTPKFDAGAAMLKKMSRAEVIGDKIASTLLLRYTDDDYATYSIFRPVDLSTERARIRRLGDFTRRSFELLHVKNALLRLEALEIDGGQ